MRISAKGRYALAAVTSMAGEPAQEWITVLSISESLGISKIYLEQIFSLLKRAGLVHSVKGAQGGYRLARTPGQISVFDVLSAVELSLFEPAEESVSEMAPHIESAMRRSVFEFLDETVRGALSGISVSALAAQAEENRRDSAPMFYI